MDDRDILDLINSGKVEMFDYSGFFKKSCHLQRFETMRIATSFPMAYDPTGRIDIYAEYMSRVRDDIRRSIHNKVISTVIGSDEISILNYRGRRDSEYAVDLAHEIRERSYRNVVVSPKIGAIIQDTAFFMPDSGRGSGSMATCYRIGSVFGHIDVYVDPFMKWDDMRVCLFGDVFVNIGKTTAAIVAEATFAPKMVLDCQFCYNSGPSEVMYLLDDEYPNLEPGIATILRDRKINGLLNEKD